MNWILHIIHELSGGGASREMVNVARHLNAATGYRHKIIALKASDVHIVSRVRSYGIEVIESPTERQLFDEVEAADIVQLEWWNCSLISALLHMPLPPCRLVIRYHVAGDKAPHIITPNHLKLADRNILSKGENPVLDDFDEAWKDERVECILHGSDFNRMPDIQLRPHTGFNVGYIGTVAFVKMHPDYVAMSNRIDIPDVNFVVCGSLSEPSLIQEVKRLNAESKFHFKGYLEDLTDVIADMDVFGYPLCPDTYASTELVLQEVMYAGIPPVVFPYGGVAQTVKHNENGYIVHSADEYVQAIEYLYRNPEERKRLGTAARQYVISYLGVENTTKNYRQVYDRLLKMDKMPHRWGVDYHKTTSNQPVEHVRMTPASILVESLGEREGDVFRTSMESTSLEKILRAEISIRQSRYVLAKNGVIRFRNLYPEDPFLNVWAGLCCETLGDPNAAAVCFSTAIKLGLTQWRVYWYLARVLEQLGEPTKALRLMQQLQQAVPGFKALIEQFNEVQPEFGVLVDS